MKYFLHTNLRGIKNLSQNKIKLISKRGKNKVGKGLERDFWDLILKKIFLLLFLNVEKVQNK